ncbi:MAG TPA: DinB family protein [Thermoanaerobaculia bacterium]
MHVVIHGGYHRGQIAAELRAAGFTPAYTDYIEAVRRGRV